MISLKTKYAIKALIALAEERQKGGASLRIEDIATRANIPKRFLEHILIEIRKGGLISSRRGREGGYLLIREPDSVSVGAVLRMIDGPIAPLPCLSRKAYHPCEDCRDETTCQLRRVFGDLFSAYLLMVESLTLADLLRDDSLVLAEPSIPPAPTAS